MSWKVPFGVPSFMPYFFLAKSMTLYTTQIAKWRTVKKLGIELVDTTIKSGFKHLAPSWDMVMGVKDGTLSEELYTDTYLKLLQERYSDDPEPFMSLLTPEPKALTCYCRAFKFCHRKLLLDFLKGVAEEHNLPFTYGGEIL